MRVTLLHIANDGNADDPARAPPGVRRHRGDQRRAAAAVRRADLRGRAAARATSGTAGCSPSTQVPTATGTGMATVMRTAGRCSGASPSTRPSGQEEDRAEAVREPAAAYDTIARPRKRLGLPAVRRLPGRPGLRPFAVRLRSSRPRRRAFPSRLHARACGRAAGVHGPGRDARAPGWPAAAGIAGIAARDDLYAAPVAVPAPAEDLTAERPPSRPRPEPEMLRPVESGYNPGAVRDQFQLDAQPGAVRGGCGRPVQPGPGRGPGGPRLARPRSGGCPSTTERRPGPLAGQPSRPVRGRSASRRSRRGRPVPANQDLGAGPSPSGPGSGGQPIAPVVPMEQPGQGYGANRAPASVVRARSTGRSPGRPAVRPGRLRGAGRAGRRRPRSAGTAGPTASGPESIPRSARSAAAAGRQQDVGGAPGYSGGSPGSRSPTRCSRRTRRARRSASRWRATRPRCGWKPCLPGSPGCRLTLRPAASGIGPADRLPAPR